jgi:deoxyribodipyrimidine photo-lyase
VNVDRHEGARAPAVVWFRDDLRIADQTALSAAAADGRPIVACYVLDPNLGAASRWWLHGSLASLARALAARGGRLVLRRGAPSAALAEIAAEVGAAEVHASKSYEPLGRAAEQSVRSALAAIGAELVTHAGALLFDPETIRTRSGEPFRVFTPFWQCCLRHVPAPPRAGPRDVVFAQASVAGDPLGDWGLRPSAPDWASGFADQWSPGEDGAGRRLASFVAERLEGYRAERERPDRAGSSRLSPHLHFGEVSARSVWAATAGARGGEAFRRELGWREFARHLLWHWPEFATDSFRSEFRRFPWRDDAERLASWQRGTTGYPIVDAGMRELWHTGWMHNRVRMVAASFLVKHLEIPWQRGAAWFWDTLVDADVANNSVGWQWVAGSGADAAPYFRVFNPTLQGRKFDPDGAYVRRWVPELGRLPSAYVHEPAAAPPEALRAAGVELGASYPRPIVEHRAARAAALAAYQALRGGAR